MNIPYLIFNFIEYIIIFPIVFTIFVKYLAERKGWDSPYEKAYSLVSLGSIFYFTLLLLIVELPDYFHVTDAVDYTFYLLITYVLMSITDFFFTAFLSKIIYKKEIRELFFFTLTIIVFKMIISFCVGLLLSPLGIVIQDL